MYVRDVDFNFATKDNHVKIHSCTSYKSTNPPNRILEEVPNSYWLSEYGCPQEITLDLTQIVNRPKNGFRFMGIYCKHAHLANPKEIHILCSENNKNYSHYGAYEISNQPGLQLYEIENCALLQCKINNTKGYRYNYMKIVIKQNYGGERTYLNQFFLFETLINYPTRIITDLSTQEELSSKAKEFDDSFNNIFNNISDQEEDGENRENNKAQNGRMIGNKMIFEVYNKRNKSNCFDINQKRTVSETNDNLIDNKLTDIQSVNKTPKTLYISSNICGQNTHNKHNFTKQNTFNNNKKDYSKEISKNEQYIKWFKEEKKIINLKGIENKIVDVENEITCLNCSIQTINEILEETIFNKNSKSNRYDQLHLNEETKNTTKTNPIKDLNNIFDHYSNYITLNDSYLNYLKPKVISIENKIKNSLDKIKQVLYKIRRDKTKTVSVNTTYSSFESTNTLDKYQQMHKISEKLYIKLQQKKEQLNQLSVLIQNTNKLCSV